MLNSFLCMYFISIATIKEVVALRKSPLFLAYLVDYQLYLGAGCYVLIYALKTVNKKVVHSTCTFCNT